MMEIEQVAEGAERAAWRELFEGSPQAVRERLGLSVRGLGAGIVLEAAGIDSFLFNRVVGLGVSAPATPEMVADVVSRYRALGVRRYFVHLAPNASPQGLRGWLEREGLVPYRRAWVKFVRGAEDVRPPPCPFELREATPREREAFGEVLGDGFELDPSVRPLFGSIVGRPSWHALVALEGRDVVAAGALFVRAGVGYLAFAATRPEHRRRGAQRALIAARIHAARTRGCRWIVSETGEAVLDQANHSYENLLRAGFRASYTRANFAPPGATWR